MSNKKYTRRDLIFALVYKHKGVWMDIYNAIAGSKEIKDGITIETEPETPTEKEIIEAYNWLKSKKLNYIYLEDQEYPEKYKGKYYKPPFIIFVDENGNQILDTEMDYSSPRSR